MTRTNPGYINMGGHIRQAFWYFRGERHPGAYFPDFIDSLLEDSRERVEGRNRRCGEPKHNRESISVHFSWLT